MREIITIGPPHPGIPIVIGGEGSAYPASQFGKELETIGYDATRAAFPEHSDADIRYRFDPDDPHKVQEHVTALESLGRYGVCLAVPQVMDITHRVERSSAADGEPTLETKSMYKGPLLGFGMLTTNKSTNRFVHLVAESILHRPAIAKVAMIHVRPESRMQGIGSLLLQQLAATALYFDLQTKPEIHVIDGDQSGEDMLAFYGVKQAKDIPSVSMPDYFGANKPATIKVYESPSWKHLIINIARSKKLPVLNLPQSPQMNA